MSEDDKPGSATPDSPLRKISPIELDETLKKHRVWRETNGTQGTRANLANTDLQGVNLQGADLCRADLQGADLADSNLRDANLADANLEGVKSLFVGQLAGTVLTGATLSPNISDGFLVTLNTVAEAAKNAGKLLFGLLGGCVYSWLTIVTTTDARLLTNTSTSPLPVIGTAIPIAGFHWAAPVLLIAVFLYLHLSLQHLWGLVATLPAVFPDGVPLDKKAYPWLLTGLVCIHVPRLRTDLPALARLRALLAVILTWWIVPVTMLLFWGRYLRARHWPGTILHIALVVLAITSAMMLYGMACRALRGDAGQQRTARKDTRAYRRAAAVLVTTATIVASMSLRAIHGAPSDPVPQAFSALGYSVFADLREATVSIRPPEYATIGKPEREEFVQGADLRDRNLRHIDASVAFLQKANLSDADLFGASLSDAILIDANLTGAIFTDATLTGATLTDADFTSAILDTADLIDADLTAAYLGNATLTNGTLNFAILIGANLTGADLSRATITNANFTAAILDTADLTGADLTGAVVTQDQLDLACGDAETQLSEGLTISPCPEDSAPPQP